MSQQPMLKCRECAGLGQFLGERMPETMEGQGRRLKTLEHQGGKNSPGCFLIPVKKTQADQLWVNGNESVRDLILELFSRSRFRTTKHHKLLKIKNGAWEEKLSGIG